MMSGSEAAKCVLNKRGTLWEDGEVNALIAVWGEEDIKAKLDGATQNLKVFEVIAQKLKDLGFEGRTAIQCREKIQKIERRLQEDKGT